MLEKYERVSLQLRLIAEDVKSDPKSETFRYFMNLAQIELEQLQDLQTSLMADYGIVFKDNCSKFTKNHRNT